MRAAIYARKSTEQHGVQDEQKSVARQVAHARQFADREGWSVVDECIYVDDGISGAEFLRRPGFLRLMNALTPKPAFDVVILSEESRLGREAIETAYALKRIISAGVRVFFYLEGRERILASPTDKLLMSVTAFADELERDRARQRTFDALYRKAQAGHVTGGRVFGYDNVDVQDSAGRRTHVERKVNDSQAAVIRRVFELAAAGTGYRRIALQLNEEGALAPRPQRGRPASWCPSSVYEALHRDLYRGLVVWNKSRKRDTWGRKNQQPRAEGEWLQHTAEHLRIVDDQVWQVVHERISRRRAAFLKDAALVPGRPVAKRPSPYLLSGFVECGCCHGTLTIRTRPHGRRRVPRLACWHYKMRGRTVCANNTEAPLEQLTELVIETIESEIFHVDTVAIALKSARAMLTADRKSARQDTDQSTESLIELDREAERLAALTAAGVGDLPAVVTRLRAIKVRRDALMSRQQVRQVASRATDVDHELQMAAVETRLQEWRRAMRANPDEARGVLEQLLSGRIQVTPRPQKAGAWRSFDVRIAVQRSGLFEGIICPRAMASPTGFEPVF